jgi:hypothetical protein
MLAAILVCGAMCTSCKSKLDPSDPSDPDLADPLTVELAENGEIDIYLDTNLPEPVYYSVNGGKKQAVAVVDEEKGVKCTTLDLKAGDKVQFFSCNTTLNDRENGKYFSISFEPDCYVYGNVMSLISPDGNWKDNKEIKEPYALAGLLMYSSIVTHPTRRLMLPATKLAKDCYSFMFSSSSIEVAPELPATTLAESCYNYMFGYCDNLKKAPALPATKLALGCYSYMFWSCDGLTEAPALPATQLAESCYEYMFCGCLSLASAPELPATQLAKNCYCYMFGSCKSLTAAPQLPATTLAEGCYLYMFKACEKLTQAPQLPATKMETKCYSGMFAETALTAAPVLPSTSLAESCYEGMFCYCPSLAQAPALPATQLANRCYAYMFEACTSLSGAIELPAQELPERCYYSMFNKCLKLNNVKCLATTMSGDYALLSWLKNAGTDPSVSTRTLTHAAGTPWVNSNEETPKRDGWYAPEGWTLVSL